MLHCRHLGGPRPELDRRELTFLRRYIGLACFVVITVAVLAALAVSAMGLGGDSTPVSASNESWQSDPEVYLSDGREVGAGVRLGDVTITAGEVGWRVTGVQNQAELTAPQLEPKPASGNMDSRGPGSPEQRTQGQDCPPLGCEPIG